MYNEECIIFVIGARWNVYSCFDYTLSIIFNIFLLKTVSEFIQCVKLIKNVENYVENVNKSF